MSFSIADMLIVVNHSNYNETRLTSVAPVAKFSLLSNSKEVQLVNRLLDFMRLIKFSNLHLIISQMRIVATASHIS